MSESAKEFTLNDRALVAWDQELTMLENKDVNIKLGRKQKKRISIQVFKRFFHDNHAFSTVLDLEIFFCVANVLSTRLFLSELYASKLAKLHQWETGCKLEIHAYSCTMVSLSGVTA